MPLADRYRAFLLDLDGVLYRGDRVIPGAPEAVARLRQAGGRVVFVTNNSARTPDHVADRLRGMGFSAQPGDVVTSAQATARVVAGEAGDGRDPTAFVVGEEGIRTALAEAGIELLDDDPGRVGFVVVGWDRGVTYDRLRTASLLVRRGARLVATNTDATYPAPGGELWPGAGALVAAVETASGVAASVVGKPQAGLFRMALEVAGTGPALVVGDRLETDVAGAMAAGLEAVLVLTGAASPADLLDHPVIPMAVLADVSELLQDRPAVSVRPAEEADRRSVDTLVAEAGLEPFPADQLDATVVAATGAHVVATAAVEAAGSEGYLRTVAVARAARGLGVGAQVVAGAVRRAVDRGVTDVFLVTEDGSGFFQRLGFEPLARQDLPQWIGERATSCSASATAMRRAVS